MPEPRGFPSFKTFIESLQSEKFSLYSARAETKMPNRSAFEEMRDHILNLYKGTQAAHSFMDESGAIFDCIPIEQQPALRDSAEPVFKPPDLPPQEEPRGPKTRRKETLVTSPLGSDKKDPHGNVMHCPAGTVPIRRITLEELTRFPTLRDFLQKGPKGVGRPPQAKEIEPPGPGATHRWAHAYQNVINGGGHSFVNLWNPSIGPNQIFSLSQHWYVAGNGANLQTVECGWQVYPGRLHDTRTHLFTYFTADDYNTTGCYDLTAPAFVQLSPSFAPGMVLSPTSTIGGSMYIIELSFWHANGHWILYFNGQRGQDAIGYYPDALFNGGALTHHATEIDYGGETVGTTSFPAMGSGRFAHDGWRFAAYQRTIGYWTPQGGAMCTANLTPSQAWPNCYTAEVQMSGDPWYETLWFGGPGGNC
jgi:hypothetical protein